MSLVRAIAVQSRVMAALTLRDIFARHESEVIGHLWLFIEPILITLLVLSFHWGGGFNHGEPVVALILTGFTPHLLLRHGGLSGITAVSTNVAMLYHRQVHYLDLVVVRLGLEILFVLVAFCTILFVFAGIGLLELPKSLGYFYLGWFFHIWFVTAICFILTGWGLRVELVRRLFMPLTYLMIPVYGAFFMLSWVSPQLRNFLLWFPPANATEMIRRGYFGDSVQTYFDVGYTSFMCLLLTFVGLLLMQHARSKLEF